MVCTLVSCVSLLCASTVLVFSCTLVSYAQFWFGLISSTLSIVSQYLVVYFVLGRLLVSLVAEVLEVEYGWRLNLPLPVQDDPLG